MGARESVGQKMVSGALEKYPAEEVSGPEESRSTFTGKEAVTKADKNVKKFSWSIGSGHVLLKKAQDVEISKVGESQICVAEVTGISKIWGTGKTNVGIKKGNVLYFHSMIESRSVIGEAKVTILEECMNSEFAIQAGKVICINHAKSNLNLHKSESVELEVWDPNEKKLLNGAEAEAMFLDMGGNLLTITPADLLPEGGDPTPSFPPLPSPPEKGAGPNLSAVQALNHNMNFQLGAGLGVGMGGYGRGR